MKNPLTKISNDLLEQERPYPGHYRDQNGIPLHGIYVRQYQKTEDKLIISNGNLMRKYKYPHINQTFHSPMLNDYNLHLCGGWRWWGVNDIECITRVFNGKKPMRFWGTDDEESYNYWLHGRHRGVSLNLQAKIPTAMMPNVMPMILGSIIYPPVLSIPSHI
jgi:hypothetical protein